MPDQTFETRLASQLTTYAQGGVRPIDRYAIAEATVAAGRPRVLDGRTRWLVPVLLGLLLVVLAAGVVLVGSGLLDGWPESEAPELPAVVAPSADPSAPPVEEPYVEPTRQPDPSQRPAADQPCPAMVQLLARYFALENPTGPIPPVGPVTGNGDILVRTTPDARGDTGIGRLDPSQSPPAPVQFVDGVELPFQSAAVSSFLDPKGRLVVSPDGRAVAFEAGDLGQAGCGDPIVVPAGNGLRRPFPGRAFEVVADLAWAPDGSALYAIRRPTLDALGQPYHDRETGLTTKGPGTVVRWDSATGEVTELPAGCEDCFRLIVSPDGSRIAAESNAGRGRDPHPVGVIKVYDAAGGWRDVTEGDDLSGWADDETIILNGYGAGRRVSVDGGVTAEWGAPCCHGTGFGGPLSPDGTTIAGVTLDSDFIHQSVTLVDVRDGSTRIIWNAPTDRACDAFTAGSSGLADCLAGPHPTPGSPDAISDYGRIVAWAPDGSAVLLLDQSPDTGAATLQVVPVDGSGAGAKVAIEVPDLSATLGFPNVGPAIVWLPATAP